MDFTKVLVPNPHPADLVALIEFLMNEFRHAVPYCQSPFKEGSAYIASIDQRVNSKRLFEF